jgi:rare lipoprotein A
MTAYTAAHRKLPLGSMVRVLNLENGKSVQVRITDRGPYVVGRMLDLSQAAARDLDMVDMGTAAVQIEVIGEHRAFEPVPACHPAHMLFSSGSSPTSREAQQGMEPASRALRFLPHEALYVRRERRSGSMLAVDHTAHRTVPVLLVS